MTVTPAPVNEIGYQVANPYYWWLYENETTPELVWPQSVYVYDQMRRTDAQVGSVLRAVTYPLLRTPWRVDPNGARDEVVQFVADDLGLPVVGKPMTPPPRMKDRFSWQNHLSEALLMLPLGHSYFEQVYRVDPDGSRAHLRKLALRPAKSIQKINVAPDGGLVSIEQYWAQSEGHLVTIPVDRLVAYIHAKEGANWLGTSLLRNCYKNWLLKDRLLRVQAQTIERNGMGIPLYEAPPDVTDLSTGLAMAKAWRAGDAAGTAIPHGAKLTLVGVTGTLPDAEPAVRYHDEQIARAVLAHFLNLGTQTGSWALGSTFADFFTLSLQTLAQQIADVATQHVVEDLVDVNFGEDEPSPRICFDEIGSRQAATAESLKALVDAGVIRPDEALEGQARQYYGLPPADTATARDQSASGGQVDSSGAPVYASGDDAGPKALTAPTDGFPGDIGGLIRAAAAYFDPSLHPRDTHGRFRTVLARVLHALDTWSKGQGPDDPLPESVFTREHLRQAALHRGLTLKRGESRKDIHDLLLADARAFAKANRETPKSAKFTLQGPNHNGLDVAVYRDPQGRPALFRENDAGKRGALVAQFDDLAGLEKWADGNGEPRLAEWARKEQGAPSAPSPAKKARAKKAAPIVAPPADGLDKMADHSLRDLAMEYGLKVPTIDQMPQHRQRLIEELRKLGAVSPALKVAREKARDDLDEHLFQLGRRKPANTAPLDRAVLAMANGDDGKAVALGLRRDAIAEKASLSAEDLKTYQLLAARIGSIKPRPAWVNDNGNIVLDKLVRAEAPNIDLATVESASIRDWLEGRNPQPDFASHPWARTFEHKRDDLQTGKTTRAKAVREFRDQATFIDKRVAEIEAKDVAWRKQHDRTPYAIKYYKPTPAEEKLRADGPAAAKAYRELADFLAAAKIPAKPRQKSLAPTELGEVLPIDESRFRSVPFHAAVTTRGQPLDPGFSHRGPTGGGVMFLFAPGVTRPQRDGLTKVESGALDHYTVGRVARALNGSLRKGHNAHGEVSFPEIGLKDPIDLDAMRAGMDSAIEAGTLDTDTVLWRGVLLKKADRNRLVPGAILSDPAYSSTTVSEHDADRVISHWRQAGLYKGSAPAKFKILAPAGTHGAVGHAAVSEVVLARDQKFRIVREEPPGKDGVPVFVLEAVAPETDSGLVRGHDVVDTFDYTAVPKLTSTWSSATSSPDGVAQRAIYEEQGFTGLPRVITTSEMDEAIKRRGAVELFRGFRPTRKNDGSASVDRTAASFAEQFRTGELYLGSGGAVYGRGTYASPDRTFAASYAGRARSGTSAAIAKAEEGVVMRMALRRDARVIHYDDVRKLHLKAMPWAMRELDEKQKAELDAVHRADTAKIQEILDRYAHLRQKSSVRSRVISDLGNFAALMGYDAIVVPVEYRGGKGKGSPTEYVILNRTALLVQEAST